MLILHLNVCVQFFIDYIESRFGHLPIVAGILEKVLMKVADVVVVALINLANALGFDDFSKGLMIDLCIEGEFDGIDHVFVEIFQVYAATIALYRVFHMLIDVFIGDES